MKKQKQKNDIFLYVKKKHTKKSNNKGDTK